MPVEPRVQKALCLLCDFSAQLLKPVTVNMQQKSNNVLPHQHYLCLLMSLCKTQILKQLGSEQRREFSLL